MTASIPEGFRRLDVTDDFVSLLGPLWFKAEEDGLRIGLPLEQRHGNPMGVAHGGLLFHRIEHKRHQNQSYRNSNDDDCHSITAKHFAEPVNQFNERIHEVIMEKMAFCLCALTAG